jgi:hypothetical protein
MRGWFMYAAGVALLCGSKIIAGVFLMFAAFGD